MKEGARYQVLSHDPLTLLPWRPCPQPASVVSRTRLPYLLNFGFTAYQLSELLRTSLATCCRSNYARNSVSDHIYLDAMKRHPTASSIVDRNSHA